MMNKVDKGFDWLAFLVRVVGVIVLATLWLAESVHKHNRTGAILAVAIGYAVLPAIAYWHTRYYNSKFTVRVVEAVKKRIARRRHAG
ncbi:MAG: hypothetical protein WCA41_06750 [Candidatus Acidiferrum sp.]